MKNFVQALFGRVGYRITKLDAVWRPEYGLDNFFPLLKGYGFAPKHIIDVGANRGDWTRKAVRYFPDAQYTLVEPQDDLKKNIEDLLDAGYKIKWVNAGAGEESGVLAFTVSHRHDSSTFVMSEDEARAAGLRQIPVRVKTLNEIAREAGGATPEMVKIDAEGFDLKALAGATELMGKTEVFLVEACVCSTSGPNTALEVMKYMDAAGYRLIDVTDLNRSPRYGVLWLGELAFLRKASGLLERVTSYE